MKKHIISNRGGQIRWISSLRGLLVFLVFFSHLTILPIHKDLMFIIGRIGVAGFFLISGHLAVASLEKRNSRQFLLNRFFRIYPIYWLLLFLTFMLTDGHTAEELLWNFTLFEEFVGYEAMIGSAWMLPIMAVFFVLLLMTKKGVMSTGNLYYSSCIGSLVIGVLRNVTGKPFPTALCLLMCVGLLGFMQRSQEREKDGRKLRVMVVVFEVTLVVASVLSYGERGGWYFIAYNIGFMIFFLFQRYNVSVKMLEKLGDLGFTFFLGASIPIMLLGLVYDLSNLNIYLHCIIQFVLTLLFAYVVTRWCEKPLLAWSKRMEKIL